MATFNAKSFEKKLKLLDGSQTGIQTLSLWIIHHRSHSKLITVAWLEYLKKVSKPERKLGLFYLANDVVQNGKRKAKELTHYFAKVFKEALPMLLEPKIKKQVERVLEIWSERNVFDGTTMDDLKLIYGMKAKEVPIPKKIVTPKKIATPEKQPIRKVVPPDFKVAKLLVSIKKATSLENDLERKSKTLDNLKIDASSFDSVQHVKDRSSVGKFFKQFEESKIILDDYCHNLRRSEKEKKSLMTLLTGGEAFYELAQEEAKVIVKAYDTFGNRLNAMKKKLDSKIKKLGVDPSLMEKTKESHHVRRSDSSAHDDMDLASDSGDEIPISEQYNPSTAPAHQDLSDDAFEQMNAIRETSIEEEDDQNTTPNDQNTPLDENTPEHTLNQSQHPIITQHPAVVVSTQQEVGTQQISDSNLFFNPDNMNGMTSFLSNSITQAPFDNLPSINISQQSAMQDVLTNTVQISDRMSSQQQLQPLTQPPSMSNVLQKYGLLPISTMSYNPIPINNNIVTSNPSTPVVDELLNQQNDNIKPNDGNVQNLIDSLFPMLSKSLQTIKEKQQNDDSQPSVNDAMAFALGNGQNEHNADQQVPKKKSRFSYTDPNQSEVSPVSLTNPKGLSNNQAELINIAAGLTKFDENFLPVNRINNDDNNMNNIDQQQGSETHDHSSIKDENDDREKRRDDRKSRHTSSRHKSSSHRDDERHRRSSSRSPSRKSSSHRSSRESRDDRSSNRDDRSSRDEKHSDRRRSKHSNSPKRRKSRSSRPSSSNERDDKRRHSPYYNDRRSPTPEMDSQISASAPFNQVQPQTINTNPPIRPTFQMPVNPNLNNHSIPNHSNSNLINPIMSVDATNIFSTGMEPKISNISMPEPIPTVGGGQANISSLGANDQSPFLNLNPGLRQPLNFNPLQMVPPKLEFDSTGRPVLAPNFQIRPANQLQLIQGQDGNVIHLRPFPPTRLGLQPPNARFTLPPPQPHPGMLPFNAFNQMPPNVQRFPAEIHHEERFSAEIHHEERFPAEIHHEEQLRESVNRSPSQDHHEHAQQHEQNENEFPRNEVMSEDTHKQDQNDVDQNPIRALSQQANQEGGEGSLNFIETRLQKLAGSSMNNNGCEGVQNGINPHEHMHPPQQGLNNEFPPLEMRNPNRPIFRPRYRPRFAAPDPLLDQLESRNPGPQQFEPRFRPRFQPRFRPRFRPQFSPRHTRF